MYKISENLNRIMSNKRPLDLIISKEAFNINTIDMVLYQNDLITIDNTNTLRIFDQYGIDTNTPNNSVSMTGVGEFKDMILVDNKIYIFTNTHIGSLSISLNTNGKNILSSITTIPNGAVNFDAEFKVKYFNGTFYFKHYNKVFLFTSSGYKGVYTHDYFILEVEMISTNEILLASELGDKSQLFLINISNLNSSNIINRNIHLPLSVEFEENEYLSFVNFIQKEGNYVYTTQNNGYVHRAKLNSVTGELGEFHLHFKTTGYSDHVVLTSNYMFTVNSYDDIYIYDLNTGTEEILTLDGSSLELVANDIIMAVLYTDNRSNKFNMINYYSVMQEFPTIQINNVKLERRANRDSNGNHLGTYSYYNAMNIMLKDVIPNRVNKTNIDLNIRFKNFPDININFKETNNPKNIYIPLIDKTGNDIVTSNINNKQNKLGVINYADLFSNIRLEDEIRGDDVIYTMTDNKYQIEFVDTKPVISTDFYNDLNYIDFKDFYYLNGYIYFRLRVLIDHPDLFISVGILDNNVFNSMAYYNKDFNPTIESKIRDDKDFINNLYNLDNKKIDPSTIDKNNSHVEIYNRNHNSDPKDHISKEYNWFRFKFNYTGDISLLTKFTIYYTISYYNGTSYEEILYQNNILEIPKSYQKEKIKIIEHTDIKSKTFDGDIQLIENIYLSKLNKGNKDLFMDNMSNVSFEKIIQPNEMIITDKNYIVNGETISGYLALPIEYNSYQFKTMSFLGEIYINGKKAFNKFMRQKNNFDGIVRTYYPTEMLKPLLDDEDYQRVVSKKNINAEVIGVLRKRRLENSEDVLAQHIVNNTYQNEIQMLQTTGIYFNIKIANHMSSDRFRVFIRGRKNDTFARLNPERYNMKLDREYGQILLRIPSVTYIEEGMTILIVSNGVTDRTIFYDKLSELYPVDSVPLLQTTNDKYLMMTGKRTDDVDININGLTLIPNIDFTIMDDVDADGNPLALAVFKNIIPKGSILEINFLDEGTYHTRFFPKAAISEIDGTVSNIIVLEDDYLFFRKGLFEIYANNLRISLDDIEVINSKAIKINNPNIELINIMIRFSFEDNQNIEEYFQDYKLRSINNTYPYYQSKTSLVSINSNFDKYSMYRKSNTSGKFILKQLLKEINNGEYRYIEDTKIDANDNTKSVWDISVDGLEIDSQYITDNLFIRSNIDYNGNVDYIKYPTTKLLMDDYMDLVTKNNTNPEVVYEIPKFKLNK